MSDRDIHVRLVFSKRQLLAAMAAVLVLGAAYALRSETVTLSTYYPAPSGVYKRLVTTGNTVLARDGSAKVGVGTTAPSVELDVNGQIKGRTGLCIGNDCKTGWPRLECKVQTKKNPTTFEIACPEGYTMTGGGGIMTYSGNPNGYAGVAGANTRNSGNQISLTAPAYGFVWPCADSECTHTNNGWACGTALGEVCTVVSAVCCKIAYD